MIRVCCNCRREISGEGKSCTAAGPKIERGQNETSGMCWACFERLYGDLDLQPFRKKEESAGV